MRLCFFYWDEQLEEKNNFINDIDCYSHIFISNGSILFFHTNSPLLII